MIQKSSFTNIKFFNKESASATNIYFANFNINEKVVMKVYVDILPSFLSNLDPKNLAQIASEYKRYVKDIKGLDYEVEVYKTIQELIDSDFSPNFINFVDYKEYKISEFVSLLNSNSMPKEKYNLSKFIGQNSRLKKLLGKYSYNNIKYLNEHTVVKCLVTKEHNNVVSLSKLLYYNNITEDDLYKIIYQLIYTLKLLEIFRIQHHDLHLENILVEQLQTPTTLAYNVYNKIYKFETKYIVRIFDWDLSYSAPNKINQKILNNEMWDDLGITNSFKEGFDLFTVFCLMNKMCNENQRLNSSSSSHLSTNRTRPSPLYYQATSPPRYKICVSKIISKLFPKALKSGVIAFDNQNYYIKGFNVGGKFINNNGFLCRANKSGNLKFLDTIDDMLFNPIFDKFITNDTFYNYKLP